MAAGKVKMGDLSEREMLLLLIDKVDRLEAEVALGRSNQEAISKLEIRLVRQEVQAKIWGTVIGFLAGGLSSIILKFIHLQ